MYYIYSYTAPSKRNIPFSHHMIIMRKRDMSYTYYYVILYLYFLISYIYIVIMLFVIIIINYYLLINGDDMTTCFTTPTINLMRTLSLDPNFDISILTVTITSYHLNFLICFLSLFRVRAILKIKIIMNFLTIK
jgi:hypothetical protein